MRIRLSNLKGEIPKLADNLLPDQFASESIACKFTNGNLAPFKQPLLANTPSKTGIKRTIYLWNATHSTPGFWFHWLTDVDVVRGPVAGDTQATTYFTGDGIPKLTDATMATGGGGTAYPTNSHTLGVPAPEDPVMALPQNVTRNIAGTTQANPVVVISSNHGRSTGDLIYIENVFGMTELNARQFRITVLDANNFSLQDYVTGVDIDSTGFQAYTSGGKWTLRFQETDLERRAYVYTYVSANQEEGPPSDALTTVDVGPGQPVALSGMTAAPVGDYNIITKRIYRSATVGGVTSYYYVGEVLVGTSTFTDAVAAADIGEQMQSLDWDMPPNDLQGLIELNNGVLAGFTKNEVCFSHPYQPHAWPTRYRQATTFPIVGMASFGSTVVAVTEVDPYVVTGIEPRSMSGSLLRINQGCTSKRGVASVGGTGVVYPSPDGLIFVSMTGTQNITAEIFKREDWQALDPTSFNACVHDGKYHCFYDTGIDQGMFIIDPNDPGSGITFYNVFATACYVDHLKDIMYLQIGSNIVAWDQASTFITYRWRSKEFNLDNRATFQAGMVKAVTYNNLTMRFFVDGNLKHAEVVMNDQPFRMPGGYSARRVQIELEGTDEVKSVSVSETISELAS